MPLIFQQDINEFAKIGIWELKEVEFFFSAIEMINNIAHPSKRLQHLAGRNLLKELYPDFPIQDIAISLSGKPILIDGSYYFSISHTNEYVAAIVSKHENVGIDIEKFSPKIMRVLKRVLSNSELILINKQNWAETYQAEILMWCIKEAVYKWLGEKNISFQKNINVVEIDNINKRAIVEVKKSNNIKVLINYMFYDVYCLVWVIM
jgi:phosphopantetheinyl transferase